MNGDFWDFGDKFFAALLPFGGWLFAAALAIAFRGVLAEWFAEAVFVYRRRLQQLENASVLRKENAMDYTPLVMEHFENPRNVGMVEGADGIGEVGNPRCGDMMKISIKVDNDVITDCKFKTLGCGAAVATSSITTEMAKGLSLADAENITREKVAEALGGLPPEKMHCSNLAADGLRAAIKNYREKKATGSGNA